MGRAGAVEAQGPLALQYRRVEAAYRGRVVQGLRSDQDHSHGRDGGWVIEVSVEVGGGMKAGPTDTSYWGERITS